MEEQPDEELDSNQILLNGLLLYEGEDVPKNEVAGRELILQAAELDNPHALYLAYTMLAYGWDGFFDRAKAFRFLQRAVELDHLESIYALGCCYLAGGMGNAGYSEQVLRQQPVPVDIEKALHLLQMAASRGHGLAALRVAEHWEGKSEDDPSLLQKAIDWYERGTVLGEPNCLVHLADFLILGKGLPKDHKQARNLYQKASKSDDGCAQRAARQRLRDFESLETLLSQE